MLLGEERAFEDFFASYFPGLYRFVFLRVNRSEDAAEEIVQKALCKAVAKLGTYRGEAALFSWLCTFCRHEISRYMKENSRYCPQPDFLDAPEIAAAMDSLLMTAQDRPDRAVLRKELEFLVQLALEALPPHYADVLEWKYMEGLPVKEIAERLDLGLKAAESLLTRARQSFRDAFFTVSSGAAWQSFLEEGGTS
jgi:RNA polymerase sigma-70 factor (ECF subfamily)